MIDFIVGAILVVIVGLALAYIVKSHKNGIKCIGCPDSAGCPSCRRSPKASSVCQGCSGRECASRSCHADIK